MLSATQSENVLDTLKRRFPKRNEKALANLAETLSNINRTIGNDDYEAIATNDEFDQRQQDRLNKQRDRLLALRQNGPVRQETHAVAQSFRIDNITKRIQDQDPEFKERSASANPHNIKDKREFGRTALHKCIAQEMNGTDEKDILTAVKKLFLEGADPHIKDNSGNTPQMMAAQAGLSSVSDWLWERK